MSICLDFFSFHWLRLSLLSSGDPWEKRHLGNQENSQAPFMLRCPTRKRVHLIFPWAKFQSCGQCYRSSMELFSHQRKIVPISLRVFSLFFCENAENTVQNVFRSRQRCWSPVGGCETGKKIVAQKLPLLFSLNLQQRYRLRKTFGTTCFWHFRVRFD